MPPLVALFSWPLISAFIFQKFSLAVALVSSVLIAFLFLPTGISIDLPLLPAINKNTIAGLSCLLLAAIFVGREPPEDIQKGFLVRHKVALFFLALIFVGATLTVLTNREALYFGPRVLPGLRIYDVFSVLLTTFMLLIPMFLGRKYLAHSKHHRVILIALCYAGLAYSLLALFEVRMSPRLNSQIYGFFPHSWRQHVRGDGFRPIVFLSHGLMVSIFFCFCALASFGLARIQPQRRGAYLFAGVWLLGTIVLCKSLGALLITLVLLPVVWWFSPRLQVVVAATVVSLLLLYPAIRSSGIIPIDTALSQLAKFSPERAESFETRWKNEDQFMQKVSQKPLFGWGGWGRSRSFDDRGRDLTTADGHWIIVLGVGGWVRYISEIGLFIAPVLLLYLRRRSDVSLETSVLCVIVAANAVDLIPNSSITPISFLLAGALWGHLELTGPPSATSEIEEAEKDASDMPRARYTRQTQPKTRQLRQTRT